MRLHHIFIIVVMLILAGYVILKLAHKQPHSEYQTANQIMELSDTEKLPNNDSQLTEMISFTDRAARYQIKYPSSWKLKDNTNANHMIRADIVKNNNLGFQIRAFWNVTGNLEDYTDRFVTQFMHEMSGHWPGHIDETDRHCNSDETIETCTSSIFFNRNDGQQWFFKEYLFKKNRIVVVLQSGSRLEHKNNHEKALDDIAATFTFF